MVYLFPMGPHGFDPPPFLLSKGFHPLRTVRATAGRDSNAG